MASAYRILLDGAPADAALYASVCSLEVEESVDLPGAFELTLSVANDGAGDYTHINEDHFKPFAALSVEVDIEGAGTERIFDGVVLSHKFHVDRSATASTLRVWGQDASFLMNLEEKVKEWSDVTDGAVADAIFADYGITPSPDNGSDDSPSHTESGHTLMQRSSDAQFLRRLARRSGKLFRVAPGEKAGERVGYFAKPKLDGEPKVILPLNNKERAVVGSLDFEWDVARPTEVAARQALFNDPSDSGVEGGATDAGSPLLAERGLAAFAEKPMKSLLTATVDDAGELGQRSKALLREASLFARCAGEVDLAAVGAVLRAGTLARVDGAGSLFSGKYYVFSVRHRMTPEAHTMRFVLVRNAVGPKPSGGGLL